MTEKSLKLRTEKPEKIKEIEIVILNWEKYNPRKDVKNSSWFRFEHNLFDNPNFYNFHPLEILFFIYLLTVFSKKSADFSKKSSNFFRIFPIHAERMSKVRQTYIHSALKKLNEINIIEYSYVTSASRPRNVHVTDTLQIRALRNVTIRNDTKKEELLPFNFEILYKKYPLKKGKEEGIKRCKLLITTQEEYDQLSLAIDRYSIDIVKNKTESKFIKHFSTFIENRDSKPFSQPWRDWIDEDAGSAVNSSNSIKIKSLIELSDLNKEFLK
jgi:hypothetical protein